MISLKTSIQTLDKLDKQDIPGLIELSTSVGWDYNREEITTIMSSGIIYGHKNKEGKIVSSAAIVAYESKVASVGMVIVRGEYRGLGLGKRATEKCLESAKENTTVMLIATEAGKPMYEKMGFILIDTVHKYLCDSYIPILIDNFRNSSIENLQNEEIPQIITLDKNAFGDNRKTLLINRIKQAKKALVVRNADGNLVGFGLSISGTENLLLGPIIAPDAETAYLLINNLAKNHKGKIRIDVPSGNEHFMSQLVQSGFSKVSQPPIMILNSTKMPQRNRTLYGIAAQIFG
ncbi:MAG: GNAT family N-acetyltransferase [Paenisporosarcina sp.]